MKNLLPIALLLLVVNPLSAAEPVDQQELRELQWEIREAHQALDHRLDEIEREKSWIFRILGFSFLALPLAYWRYIKKAKSLADQALEEVIQERPQALRELIDERDADVALRRETQIGIVSRTLNLEGILAAHDFRKLKTLDLETARATDLQKLGAVVIDLDGGVSEDEALELIRDQRLNNALVFTTGRLEKLHGKCAFANMPVTLYGRLLELLKFLRAAETR